MNLRMKIFSVVGAVGAFLAVGRPRFTRNLPF